MSKRNYVKVILISTFVFVSTINSQDIIDTSEKAVLSHCDETFKLIKDISSSVQEGQKWTVKAFESPDEFRVYVKNVYELFDPQGTLRSWSKLLSFRINSDGRGIQVVYDKEKNPKEGGFGPAGGFDLPHQAAHGLWTISDKVRYIDPVRISENEILLTIPKYRSGSSLYDWWHRKRFVIWTASLD